MKFYTCKYPVLKSYTKENELETFSVGTAFIIKCINGNYFDMAPVTKAKGDPEVIAVDAQMLAVGFTEQDQLP